MTDATKVILIFTAYISFLAILVGATFYIFFTYFYIEPCVAEVVCAEFVKCGEG